MRPEPFRDRRSAGVLLGALLVRETTGQRLERPVVLGLPRGGVPVAAEVAAAINAPLDVIVVRKLGVPRQPELAMGAIGENAVVVVNYDVVHGCRVSDEQLAAVEHRERIELDRVLGNIRATRARHELAGCTAIIVDDGIATGATVRAAIQVARAAGAARVGVATPVSPADVVDALKSSAEFVVCLAQPDPFGSVGRWYRDFDAVSDREVLDHLARGQAQERP